MKLERNDNEPSEYANMTKVQLDSELGWRNRWGTIMAGTRVCSLYVFSPAFAAIGLTEISSGDAIDSIKHLALSLVALGAVKASNYVKARLEGDISKIEFARNNLEGRIEGGN